ncbi:MAG: flagella assembly protein FlgT middle domain-containing protein [Undibacterium curvum]|uniref:flagella assembly protein FlgT middle domain-containing protein n=1 Tax=Undibacterium curvum TaxID=2762294 RepID=UPI003BDD91A4
MSQSNFKVANFFVLICSVFCFTQALAETQIQAMFPARGADRSVLLTGFAVNKPAQLSDVDDIAQGFPREVARVLEQSQQFSVRTIPDLLSLDWQLNPPTPVFLAQVAKNFDVRYVVSGDIRNAGIRNTPVLFGLWTKKTRAIEVDLNVFDAKAGVLVAKYRLTGTAEGDVLVGRQHVFGGEGFSSTGYGKAILELAQKAALSVTTQLVPR